MAVVRSVAVKNMLGASTTPFWPDGGTELNVEFGDDSGGTCSVYGIDPENHNKVVFNGIVRTAQQDCFIEAVRLGQQGVLVSNENEPIEVPPPSEPARYLVPLAPLVPAAPESTELIGSPPEGYAVVISGGGPPPPLTAPR